jgi:chromosome segregation ATPase
MDQEQLEKRLGWLDEQNRSTSGALKEFETELEASKDKIEQQAAQISDLYDEISRLTALTTRIHQFDETLQKHRKEVSRQLESAEKRRTEKEDNLNALRKSDQQAITQRIDQLQVELKRLDTHEQALATRREEEVRLSKQATKLDKNVEKLVDKSSAQSEQLKSVARTGDQLQKEYQQIVVEVERLRKKNEELRGKLDIIADVYRTLDVRVGELSSTEVERSESLARWIERQELSVVEFENAWKKWERRFVAIEQQASVHDERLAAYEEMHRSLKQMRTDLSDLMERLERRITEVSEMQRLGESRMKHDWSSFQADDMKRWNTYKLTSDELWREHERIHDRLALNYENVTGELKQASLRLNQMTDAERQRLGEVLSMLREWISEFEDRAE